MNIITISESKSLPGRWKVTGPGKSGRQVDLDAYNAGDAAAKAVNIAMNVGGPYTILGHDKAIALIPPEIRFKGI